MKKKTIFFSALRLSFCTFFVALCLMAQAAYLENVPRVMTQPNGETLECFATGDEFYSYLHDAQGYTIVMDPVSGWFVYADLQNGVLVPTKLIPNHDNPSTKGLKPGLNISAKEWLAKRQAIESATPKMAAKGDRELNQGEYNNLIIYIRFQGDAELGTTKTEIDSMFNGTDLEDVSLYNYFVHASYNQLFLHSYSCPEPEGELLISYEDIYPREYYLPYNATTNPTGYQDYERADREFDLLQRACEFVSGSVPQDLNIDYNNDGNVDNVVFVVKGNVSDWSTLLWPHRWSLYGRDVYLNNKRVWDFNFQLETSSYFSTSTLCHEMFHSLGSPDLYHYGSDGLSPVGGWDLMCSNSQPPQHSGAYMKWKYGNWIDEIPEITEYGTYTLESMAWEGNRRNGFKIPTNNPDQFYVVEYRDRSKNFDSGLQASGLLIYRIDTRFDGNASYDGYSTFDEVYIFRPGGSQNQDGAVGSANFSANVNRTLFNSETDPYPFFTNGTVDDEFNICNVSEIGNTIQFTYCPKNTEVVPTSCTATVVAADAVDVAWSAVAEASGYAIYRDGEKIAENVNDLIYHDLSVENGYHIYYVTSVVDNEESYHSNEASVIVGDFCDLIFDINDANGNGWTGAGLQVSFENSVQKTVEYTLYEGSEASFVLSVPKGSEISLTWFSGWEDENCSFTVSYEDGEPFFTSPEELEQGVLTSFVCDCENSPCLSPSNLIAEIVAQGIQLSWSSPVYSEAYKLYRDNELIAVANTNSYLDDSYMASGAHIYKVSNDCGGVESDFSNEAFVSVMTYMASAPANLTAETQDNDNILLNWDAPTQVSAGLQYDNGEYVTSVGSASMTWAIKIEPENLANFEGGQLTQVSMYDAKEGSFTFKIYNGEATNANTLMLTQTAEMTGSNAFVEVPLSEALSYDAQLPLWITVQGQGVANPGSCCDYVGNPNSALIKAGAMWNPLPMYNQNYSWLLRGVVEMNNQNIKYNVYRNNDYLVATNVDATSYLDRNLYVNHHCYYVVATINDKEASEHSNIACASTTVSVDENAQEIAKLYPNPAKNFMKIEGNNLKSIEVFDVVGQKVMSISNINDDVYNFSVANFRSGTYIFRVISDDGLTTERVSVVH